MNVLIAVDLQNDFIDGALGTAEAVSMLPNAVEKIKNFDGLVLATRDTHDAGYLNSQEGKNLPVPHCIKDTEGWEISPEVNKLLKEEPIDKPTFGSIELGLRLKEIDQREGIDSITLIGLCTDICVISNAMIAKAFLPEVPIKVDASCCAGVTQESHLRALEAMKICQIEVI